MDAKLLKEKVFSLADELQPQFEAVCDTVFHHPRARDGGVLDGGLSCKGDRRAGLYVTKPYGGMETAFRAEKGDKGPRIAFLAEYDALPGYGPCKNENGHACGHNWIAAVTFGAAVVLGRIADELGCRAVWIGTPAEETIGGKINLIQAGAFDDIDLVLQMHLSAHTELQPHSQAMDSVEFTFEGRGRPRRSRTPAGHQCTGRL